MSPALLSHYDSAYRATLQAAVRFDGAKLHDALRLFTPRATSDADWGEVDALTDLVLEAERSLPMQ